MCWFIHNSAVFEQELMALDEYGFEYEVDDEKKAQGRLSIHVNYYIEEKCFRLTCDYPDSYPFFCVRVTAPTFPKGRHLNPTDFGLCLFADEQSSWHPSDTLAKVITEQLPIIYDRHKEPDTPSDNEEQGGYQISGQMSYEPFSVIFVDDIDFCDSTSNGTLNIRINKDLKSNDAGRSTIVGCISDIQIASLRMFSAFVVIVPFIPRALKKIKKAHIPYLIFISLIGNGLTAFLFALSQQHINSSVAGMLNATTPITTYIIGIIFYRILVKKNKILGLFIGLIGVVLLLYLNTTKSIDSNLIYMFLLIIAATFYSVNVNMVKYSLKDLNGITISILTFAIIGPIAGITFFTSDLQAAYNTPNFEVSTIYIIILGLLSSVLATVIFNILIKYTSAIFASTVTYLIPIVAIMWGFLDGEIISIYEVLAVFIIIGGIYLVNKD
ncbi:MAG: DMT family transporter [Methylococcales bacterium]